MDSPQLTVGLDDGRTNHRKGGPISICLRAGVPGSKDGPAAPPDGCMSGGRECGGGSGRRSITSSRSFLSPPGHHKARTTTGWNERGWHSRVRPVAAPAGPIARDIPLGGRESARGFRGLVPSVSCGHGHYNGNCCTGTVDVCCTTTTTTTVESPVDSRLIHARTHSRESPVDCRLIHVHAHTTVPIVDCQLIHDHGRPIGTLVDCQLTHDHAQYTVPPADCPTVQADRPRFGSGHRIVVSVGIP